MIVVNVVACTHITLVNQSDRDVLDSNTSTHVQLVGVVKPASPWKHMPWQHGYITGPVATATRSEHAFSRVTGFVTYIPLFTLFTLTHASLPVHCFLVCK